MTTTDPTNLLPAAHRARILGHMNEDHADSVLAYARHFGGRLSATAATLAGIDQNGMDLVVTEPSGEASLRIPFDPPLTGASDAHHVLIDMSREATAALHAAPKPIPERARAAVLHLRDTAQTVLLATVSADGLPDCSVAPFVLSADGTLHTFISSLSHHTANLRANAHASALLIEDEANASHLLARRRLTLRCTATFIARNDDAFTAPMQALRKKFGSVMEQLETMHDFHLVRLVPDRARLVAGFGQAYDAHPLDWTDLRHVNDTGHTHISQKA
ncbi:MAG: HutZ protein [Rariglobus sp.]|jgi:putative heme iron utilization protein|nr:HutZ protein [Rariglobus sp.]